MPHLLRHEFPKQHWVPLLPLLIYQHLNYRNKFYNFWKWKMGALIEIKCKIFNFQKEKDNITCTTYTQLAWFVEENDDVKS